MRSNIRNLSKDFKPIKISYSQSNFEASDNFKDKIGMDYSYPVNKIFSVDPTILLTENEDNI